MATPSVLSPRVRRKPAARYHHGGLRRALLDATLGIVEREGTGAVSLRAVARRVGVSPQASYNHFSDKAALLAAAAEEGVRALERQMVLARDAATGAGAELEAIGSAYVAFAVAHPAHFRLLGAPELADKRERPGLLAAYEAAFGVLERAVSEAQRERVVRAGDPCKLALTAWATVHGVAWLLVDRQIFMTGAAPDAAALARDALRVLFRGLALR